jgi:hypothetical protein
LEYRHAIESETYPNSVEVPIGGIRCGFIYSDYISGVQQRLLDGLQDFRLTQVVRPQTRVEYEILWFGLELANMLCNKRRPIVGPGWWNIDPGYVVFGMHVVMRPVTRRFDRSEPFE